MLNMTSERCAKNSTFSCLIINRAWTSNTWTQLTGGSGVRVEQLPPYAPDLNPVEEAWQHLKHVEMRNLVCLDLEERTWRNFTWNSVSPSAA